MFLQYGAIISTIAVEFVVATVVINFVGTIWGDGRMVVKNIPIRWFYTGMIFYFITCFQCALQVTLTFQKLIHFTDWVVGHAHLVMFGVFSMWIFGFMTYLMPRLFRREWYSRKLCEWHFWLSAVGVFVMFMDLGLAGVFQGFYWASLMPWEASLNASPAVLDHTYVRGPSNVRWVFVFHLQHHDDSASSLASRFNPRPQQPEKVKQHRPHK